MENEKILMMDLLIETHVDLERQGPGNSEMTVKALSFIDDPESISRVMDLGCGTGTQTMDLAKYIKGKITGVDLFPEFIDVFNENAKKKNLQERVEGIVGSMDNLSFDQEEFDLIWSEGAIDNIGFEKGVSYWHGFLKKGGHLAVSCPSWLTEEHIGEVEKFWGDAGVVLNSVGYNIARMQASGYGFVGAFTLSEKCWTDNYFTPREQKEKTLLKKYAGNEMAEEIIKNSKYESELYDKYKKYYGYVFYIGKKQRF